MGEEMEDKGTNDLKVPFLRSSHSVAVSLSPPIHKVDEKAKTVRFQIRGVKCASSLTCLESALGRLNGVENAMVSSLEGQAVVRFMPDLITVSRIGTHTLRDCISTRSYETMGQFSYPSILPLFRLLMFYLLVSHFPSLPEDKEQSMKLT